MTVVKKTQDSLGKFVKKPPLTDKLLNKPPFRFLHDVISAVIRDTGILQGLYDATEMKSENVKGRQKINHDCILINFSNRHFTYVHLFRIGCYFKEGLVKKSIR